MLQFVEVPKKKKPEKPDGDANAWTLFWLGMTIFLAFTSALLPFGAYLPVSLSVWALVIFFIPLLFIGINLLPKFGPIIFLSVFLSLLGGGVSVLFLGDFVGYVSGITAINNITPEEAVQLTQYKYVFLKDFELRPEDGGQFRAPLLLRNGPQGPQYGPILNFRYAPIRSKLKPEKAISLYALCFTQENKSCQFSSLGRGGSILQESLWESQKTEWKGKIPPEDSIFLVWRPDLPSSLIEKGFWSFAVLVGFQLIWTVSVFLPRFKE